MLTITSDGTNVLWKVQLMIDSVRNRCLAIPRTGCNYSIDEQMIPFLGRCPRPLKQYVKNKPRPVGLKNFVITTSFGLVLDFEIYQGNHIVSLFNKLYYFSLFLGKTTPLVEENLGLGASVVLRYYY